MVILTAIERVNTLGIGDFLFIFSKLPDTYCYFRIDTLLKQGSCIFYYLQKCDKIFVHLERNFVIGSSLLYFIQSYLMNFSTKLMNKLLYIYKFLKNDNILQNSAKAIHIVYGFHIKCKSPFYRDNELLFLTTCLHSLFDSMLELPKDPYLFQLSSLSVSFIDFFQLPTSIIVMQITVAQMC